MIISNKVIMYECLRKGLFGAAFRIWYSVDDLRQDGYNGFLGVREGSGRAGKLVFYDSVDDIDDQIKQFICPIYCEGSRYDNIVFSGEVRKTGDDDLQLTYSFEKNNLRDILSGQSISGKIDNPNELNDQTKVGLLAAFHRHADMLLRKYLSESSYEDMMALIQMFPGHVIEFTTYNVFVTELSGRNTVIWEVRMY